MPRERGQGNPVSAPRDVTIAGREILRTAVPAPATLLPLGSGLAGTSAAALGALGRTCRADRREPRPL